MVEFSIVVPSRSTERDLASLCEYCLPSCFALQPAEVLVALDAPADPGAVARITETFDSHGYRDRMTIVDIARNSAYKDHQAWVRRQGYRAAKHDVILTADVDVQLYPKALTLVEMVGKDNIGLASGAKKDAPRRNWMVAYRRIMGGLLALIGRVVLRQPRRIPQTFGGLYAVFRPYWLETEDEESLKNILSSEDNHLYQYMRQRYQCVYVEDFCAMRLRKITTTTRQQDYYHGVILAQQRSLARVVLVGLLLWRPYYVRAAIDLKLGRVEPWGSGLDG